MRNLRSLSLHYCKNITNTGIANITANLKQLASLDIAYCKSITDAEVTLIATDLPNLTSLDLSHCPLIGDAGIRSIATNLHLTSLNVQGCTQITDAGIKSIAIHMRSLTCLNLRGCRKITDEGIKSIVNNLPQLRELTLADIAISHTSLERIADKMHNLTSLDISRCKQVNDNTLRTIAREMPRLTCLNLSYCDNITNDGLIYLADMTNLRHLNLNMHTLIAANSYFYPMTNHPITNNMISILNNSLPATDIIGIDGIKTSPPKPVSLNYYDNMTMRDLARASGRFSYRSANECIVM